jgi:succinate dehydrogenase / fumarate reductase cytochrome b subunit
MFKRDLASSVGKKQVVAVTGLLLVGYLVFHLSANLLIFAGAEVYNFFPERAHETGLFLRLIESVLAAIFLLHIVTTVRLVIQNRRSRGTQYAVSKPKGKRSLATRLMPYTGTILVLFLVFHIKEFVFVDHAGAAGMIGSESLGVYGVVANSLVNPVRAIGYVVAMFAVGFHLAHGIQSVFQTFGFNHEVYTPAIQKVSTAIGIAFALAFSSIPVYFLTLAMQ